MCYSTIQSNQMNKTTAKINVYPAYTPENFDPEKPIEIYYSPQDIRALRIARKFLSNLSPSIPIHHVDISGNFLNQLCEGKRITKAFLRVYKLDLSARLCLYVDEDKIYPYYSEPIDFGDQPFAGNQVVLNVHEGEE